jgi:precorrin-6B methylase 2
MVASSSPNSVQFRPLRLLKEALVKGGHRPHAIRIGLYKDIVLELDLRHAMQQYLGLHERETFPFLRNAARRCTWMIDVGAGNGEMSIFFARNRHCRVVHAFEPDTEALGHFHRNLRLNGLTDESRLVIHDCFAGTGGPPQQLALDSLDIDVSQPGLLKIDVDGAETDVLDSAKGLLKTGTPDVLVEVHSEQLEADCIGRLRGFGYAVNVIDNAWWRVLVPENRPIPHNRWIGATKAS